MLSASSAFGARGGKHIPTERVVTVPCSLPTGGECWKGLHGLHETQNMVELRGNTNGICRNDDDDDDDDEDEDEDEDKLDEHDEHDNDGHSDKGSGSVLPMRFVDSRRFLLTCCDVIISVASVPLFHQEAPAMAGQIAVKPRPKTPSKVEWKALPRATGHSTIPWSSHVLGRNEGFVRSSARKGFVRSENPTVDVASCFSVSGCSKASKGTPCKGLLSDLKGQNAALQEIFWEERGQ